MENHTKSINPTKNRKTTKKKSEFFTRNYSKSKTKKMYKGNQKATLKKKSKSVWAWCICNKSNVPCFHAASVRTQIADLPHDFMSNYGQEFDNDKFPHTHRSSSHTFGRPARKLPTGSPPAVQGSITILQVLMGNFSSSFTKSGPNLSIFLLSH